MVTSTVVSSVEMSKEIFLILDIAILSLFCSELT